MALPPGLAGVVEPIGSSAPYYGNSNFGTLLAEGRFVFCATDETGQPLPGGFTVILEYPLINSSKYQSLHDWAVAWHALGKHPYFNSAYLQELAELTKEFTGWTNPKAPRLRIRTSEQSFGNVREMREFTYASDAGWNPSVMASTPLPQYETTATREHQFLGALLANRGNAILTSFPTAFKLQPSLLQVYGTTVLPLVGGSCNVPASTPAFRWTFANLNNEPLRQQFSLQTCNGCHAGETNTPDGLHIKPRAHNEAAQVSAFLELGRMLTVPSPDGTRSVHLSEMADRLTILSAFLQENSTLQRGVLAEIAARRARLSH